MRRAIALIGLLSLAVACRDTDEGRDDEGVEGDHRFTFDLAEGESDDSVLFRSPGLVDNTLTARIEVSSSDPVEVVLVDQVGVEMRLLDEATMAGRCGSESAPSMACEVTFPSLPARRPGEWEMHVAKFSGPSTDVVVDLHFEDVG